MKTAILLFLATACIWTGEVVDQQLEIRTSMGTIRCRLFTAEAPETVRTICGLAEGTIAWTDRKSGTEVKRPYFDGLTFHRVIPGFMIQGGCPLGTGTGDPGFKFKDEINAESLNLGSEKVLLGDRLNPLCGDHMAQQFGQHFIKPKLDERGISESSSREQQQIAISAILMQLKDVSVQQFYEKIGYIYDAKLAPSHRPVRGSLAMANSGPATNGSQFFINLGDTTHLTGKHTVFGEVVDGMPVVEAIGAVQRGAQDRPALPVMILAIRPVGSVVPWPGDTSKK